MYAPYKTADLDTSESFIEPWRLYLQKAADLIREKGLAKGVLVDRNGAMCTHAAIWSAHGVIYGVYGVPAGDWSPVIRARIDTVLNKHTALNKLGEYLVSRGVDSVHMSSGCYIMCGWNNAPERTAEDVIAALEGAARS